MKAPRSFLGLLLAAATACGDGTGPGNANGSLSFSHSGATTGTFSASGSVLVSDPMRSTWAAALREDVSQLVSITANLVRSAATVDNITIDLPELTTGTVPIANDVRVRIAFGQTQSGARTWGCELTSGSVVVTSLSGSRAYGTFSGSGNCLGATGLVAFAVAEGTFDVPVVRALRGSFHAAGGRAM